MRLDLSPAQRRALAYIHADEGRSGAVIVGNAAAPLHTVFALGRAGLLTLEKTTWTPRGGFRLRVQYEAKLTNAGKTALEASSEGRRGGGGARAKTKEPFDLSKVIRERLRSDAWNDFLGDPGAINSGMCDEFAEDVLAATKNRPDVLLRVTPNELQEQDVARHVWLEHRGKHYDAERPQGVARWQDLPIFQGGDAYLVARYKLPKAQSPRTAKVNKATNVRRTTR